MGEFIFLFVIAIVIILLIYRNRLTKQNVKIDSYKKGLQKEQNEMAKKDEISLKFENLGYEFDSPENRLLTAIFYKLTYFKDIVGFHFVKFHPLGERIAIELRSGHSEADPIDHNLFKGNVVNELKNLSKVCNQETESLDLRSLRLFGKVAFPSLFIFTHECRFLTKYGEKVEGVDGMASIQFEDIIKVQPGFDVSLLHMIARVEMNKFGVDMENLDYDVLSKPGIAKSRSQERGIISKEIRMRLLLESDYACAECSARAEDGATLEIDHIIPVSQGGSDEYDNLQVLCATCNRKKGSKI